MKITRTIIVSFICGIGIAASAQTLPAAVPGATSVPQNSSVVAVSAQSDPNVPGARMLRFAGAVPASSQNATGRPLAMHFALYAGQEGGEPLWSEVQQVEIAHDGSFTALLGAATPGGLPASAFQGGEARWLGVATEEWPGSEQPRLLLVGVPFALESTNAETLGGLPASAFALASDLKAISLPRGGLPFTPNGSASSGVSTAGGAANYVAKFSSSATLSDSEIYDTGTAVGIGNSSPEATLDVSGTGLFRGALGLATQGTATTATGFGSWPPNFTGSVYNSGAPSTQNFQWQVLPFLNNTAVAQGYLALNFAKGTDTPKQILAINSVGQIAFATGQIFPGVAGLGIPNSFSGTQTITGNAVGINATATSATGTGANITGGAYGVFANATGATGVGVFGSGFWGVQGVGKTRGVFGQANGANSAGVYGTGTQFGVYGTTNQGPGTVGVFGIGLDGVQGSGTSNGVYGASNTAGGIGVQGYAPAFGVMGTSTAPGSTGIRAQGVLFGLTATASSTGSSGVVAGGVRYGVDATASGTGSYGVNAQGILGGVAGQGETYGVLGQGTASGGSGVYGIGTQY
jgi:hypothetical protein